MPSPSSHFCATCKAYGSRPTGAREGHARKTEWQKAHAGPPRRKFSKTDLIIIITMPIIRAIKAERARRRASSATCRGTSRERVHGGLRLRTSSPRAKKCPCFNCRFDRHLVGACEIRINMSQILSNRSIWQRVSESSEDYSLRSIKAQPHN